MWNKISGFVVSLMMVLGVLLVLVGLRSEKSPEREEKTSLKNIFTPVEFPDQVSFAGERVPLEYEDVWESLDREMLVNTNLHASTLRALKMAPRYFTVVEPILKENGIPDDFKYLMLAESTFDERAVSSAGAAGLWQFTKETAQEYGMEVNAEVDERYNMIKATHAACRFLKSAYARFGSWTLVAASYNAGQKGVERQVDRQQTRDYYNLLFGEETMRYVFRILAFKLILESPEKYGFKVETSQKYPVYKTSVVTVSGPVANLTDFAKSYGINYRILKMFNPWLRDNKLTNSSGKTYEIRIPEKDFRIKKN